MSKALEEVVRYILIVLLVLNFAGSAFVSLINPEAYFLGEKLSGGKAAAYLLTGAIAGAIIAYLLLTKKRGGEIASVLYFGGYFIESLVRILSLDLGFLISPLFTIGLVVSIFLLFIKLRS